MVVQPGPTPSRWRGVPAGERTAERRGLLLDAAFELLGTAGWAGTTVRGVCARARLNPRYFYESFETLDDLLLAVYDRIVREAGLVAAAALNDASDDPVERTRAVLGALFRFVVDDPRRARVLFVEAHGNEPLMRRRLDTMLAMADTLDAYARATYGQPAGGERISTVAANVLVAGAAELLVAWLDGHLDMTLDQLIDDAAALFAATGAAAAAIAARRAGSP